MIRIENRMFVNLAVPFDSSKGTKAKTFTIPAASANGPGVVELRELDAVTLARLKHHYESRPIDPNQPDGPQLDIGLLRFTFVDDPHTAA
ncbi:MAG TPA: hypothetical protein VIK01_18350 [Polyangiaceae bacterium]